MSELQIIESALQSAARRRRWARALRGLWKGLFIGAVLGLILAASYKIFPLPLYSLLIASLIPFPLMLAGLIIGGWKKPGLNDIARWIDGKQHLQERLSTALEVSGKPVEGNWRELLLSDAAQHAKSMDARRLVPFTLSHAPRWALVILALTFGLGFVPKYRSKAYEKKEAEKQVIKDVGKQLAELTRQSMSKRPPALETTQKSMETVAQLGDQLTKKSLTRSEALKDLANVADRIKDQLKDLSKDPMIRKLEQTARAPGGADSQTASGMQKQMDSLQKQLGTPSGNPESMDKLKKELDKLEQAAKGLADKNSSAADSERQKLSDSLSALSKQAQEMGMQLPQLDEAIAALNANQTDLMLKDLEAATTDLEKMRDMAKAIQQLQQQMEKIGKDLAEQLKNGQPEAALETLKKMTDKLTSGNMSQEELKSLFQEVAKAVSPAGNYGKVAEHLKTASKKLQDGDKSGGSKNLADAAKELEKLMQQMGDGQAMMAELEALQKASLCISTCQGWGQCKNFSYGQGSRPGSGVGTWSDSQGEWAGEFTDRWDNTGLDRPDSTPRGVSDRGDGELSDALKPTKVKGQFTPGGQMPSITLKGVSIKGQSKVSYEEAAAAAQTDAQSALSQEKVPRAYQGAVRDYFNDIKK